MSVLEGKREEMVRCEYLMSTAEVEEITISFSTRKTKVFFFCSVDVKSLVKLQSRCSPETFPHFKR